MQERRAIAVQGVVQGVGFRPFVYTLATRLALRGFVRNRSGGVWIEVEGDTPALDHFLHELADRPPPLAQIEQLAWEPQPVRGEESFRIESSEASGGPVFVGPDVATCRDCLAELFDPADRRYRYPFLNCTNCGPRLTIITGAPYDRPRTTMAGFAMCPACRAEYEDPRNRRFHAQPTCCPACGPRLTLRDARGAALAVEDPLRQFTAMLLAGKIGALKGLGGYHLACDATIATAVAELRQRKHRDEKPFAVMVQNAAVAAELAEVSDAERQLLESPRRPIVLLRSRRDTPLAAGVAPGNPFVGIMLPYTPLHHLLLSEAAGRPLVMTSGNRSDEPIAYEDDDALARLQGIADVFLTHDRPIHVRCDDSVTRIIPEASAAGTRSEEQPIRRSRGYAPQPLLLPFECPRPILAVGGQLKGTFALGRGRHAFLSHHLGDLDHYEAFRAFEKDIALYEQLFAVIPGVIAHDLHPDYASTRHVQQRLALARRDVMYAGTQIAAMGVQHHHAHVASCMAENGLTSPVIGVAFDGTGYGSDGAIWGGEFLVGTYHGFRRAAHLRYVGMPGGDQAIREPWRMALAHLHDANLSGTPLQERIDRESQRVLGQMLERRLQTPLTSSAGRLFDAVASLAGVRDRVTFEGQAAMELEWLTADVPEDGVYPFDYENREEDVTEVDTRPLIRSVVQDVRRGVSAAMIARRFHSSLVEMIAEICGRLRRQTGLLDVALSGGVFLNVVLTREVSARLADEGFHVYRHRRVPPNDGGLSLGQLAIAAHS